MGSSSTLVFLCGFLPQRVKVKTASWSINQPRYWNCNVKVKNMKALKVLYNASNKPQRIWTKKDGHWPIWFTNGKTASLFPKGITFLGITSPPSTKKENAPHPENKTYTVWPLSNLTCPSKFPDSASTIAWGWNANPAIPAARTWCRNPAWWRDVDKCVPSIFHTLKLELVDPVAKTGACSCTAKHLISVVWAWITRIGWSYWILDC